jgi:hypothetical protein
MRYKNALQFFFFFFFFFFLWHLCIAFVFNFPYLDALVLLPPGPASACNPLAPLLAKI